MTFVNFGKKKNWWKNIHLHLNFYFLCQSKQNRTDWHPVKLMVLLKLCGFISTKYSSALPIGGPAPLPWNSFKYTLSFLSGVLRYSPAWKDWILITHKNIFFFLWKIVLQKKRPHPFFIYSQVYFQSDNQESDLPQAFYNAQEKQKPSLWCRPSVSHFPYTSASHTHTKKKCRQSRFQDIFYSNKLFYSKNIIK